MYAHQDTVLLVPKHHLLNHPLQFVSLLLMTRRGCSELDTYNMYSRGSISMAFLMVVRPEILEFIKTCHLSTWPPKVLSHYCVIELMTQTYVPQAELAIFELIIKYSF